MLRLTIISLGIAGLLSLGACAGRDARPVEAWTPYDEALECDDVAHEIEGNNEKIRLTAVELEESKGQNVGVGVVGAILFWPALFALDLSDAEKVEIAALEERNRTLTRLGRDKDCGEVPAGVSFEEVERERIEEKQKKEKEARAANTGN